MKLYSKTLKIIKMKDMNKVFNRIHGFVYNRIIRILFFLNYRNAVDWFKCYLNNLQKKKNQ